MNIDLLALFKSIGAQFWPILCCFRKLPPFTGTTYYSNKKPSNVEDFAVNFCTEYGKLRNDSDDFCGVKLSFELF